MTYDGRDRREYYKMFRKLYPEKRLKQYSDYTKRHLKQRLAYQKDYNKKNHTFIYERDVKNRVSLKYEVLSHYSDGKLECACCKERNVEFLSIDHINGKGAEHRREIGGSSGTFYRWLKNNNYPSGFRVLCINCNFALGAYGYCPHHPDIKQVRI